MNNRRRGRLAAPAAVMIAVVIVMTIALVTPRAAFGAFVTMGASRDNTLIENATGAFSDGAGPSFFVGRVDVISGGLKRRGVIAFNVAGGIPAGSTIVSVSLRLNMSRSTTALQSVSLHRLLSDWGEGTSVATGGGGGGAPSTANDATWIHTFYNTLLWAIPGGDYTGTPSTTIQVGPVGQYTFLSTPGMVADVQAWLDTPARSFGWIVIGNEAVIATAKRFDTKENPLAAARPMLTVEYAAAVPPAGRVPEGGTAGPPLTVVSAGAGTLRLSWGGSCLSTDTDYEIYAGTIGTFSSYAPLTCSTAGATAMTITPAAGSQFYLVVPRNAAREGSYGIDSQGRERPAGAGACLQQAIGACP